MSIRHKYMDNIQWRFQVPFNVITFFDAELCRTCNFDPRRPKFSITRVAVILNLWEGLNLHNPRQIYHCTWQARKREPIMGVWRQRPQWTIACGSAPSGSIGRDPDRDQGTRRTGRSPPEAVNLWAFGRQKEMANLQTFLYFANSAVQTSVEKIH